MTPQPQGLGLHFLLIATEHLGSQTTGLSNYQLKNLQKTVTERSPSIILQLLQPTGKASLRLQLPGDTSRWRRGAERGHLRRLRARRGRLGQALRVPARASEPEPLARRSGEKNIPPTQNAIVFFTVFLGKPGFPW